MKLTDSGVHEAYARYGEDEQWKSGKVTNLNPVTTSAPAEGQFQGVDIINGQYPPGVFFKGSQIFGQKNKGSQIFRRKFKGS